VFNLQGSEIIVILLIALVVLGPERLPDAIRRFMQTYNELKKMGSGFQSEIKTAFEEPLKEMRETAAVVRDAADPNKFLAEAEAEQRLRHDAAALGEASPIGYPSSNGHDPSHQANGWGRPQVPVVDPGSDTVATPGSPPSPRGSAPPPPPPPIDVPVTTIDPPPLPRRPREAR
jgi:sec-independent protein translocase protein TatB